MRSVRVLIEGRVQGVWYRKWTVQEAGARHLDGWVRNLSDGRVEAVFCGPNDAVESMIEACRQGPPAAMVSGVVVESWDEIPDPEFHERPTV